MRTRERVYVFKNEAVLQRKMEYKSQHILIRFRGYMHFCHVFLSLFHSLMFSSLIFNLPAIPLNKQQIGLALVAISTLVISGIAGYTALCVTAWGYGVALGCYRYTLKMLALERVRAKHFTKAWGKCKHSILCMCVRMCFESVRR